MHAFGQTVEIKSLDAVTRQKVCLTNRPSDPCAHAGSKQIFESIVQSRTAGATIESVQSGGERLDFVSLAYLAEGYTPADIRDLVDNAMQNMLVRVMEGSLKVRSGHTLRYPYTSMLMPVFIDTEVSGPG